MILLGASLLSLSTALAQEAEIVPTIGHSDPAGTTLVFSPSQRQIISHDDETVRIWDKETARLMRTIGVSGGRISFSPDGKLGLIGNELWDLNVGRRIRSFGSYTHEPSETIIGVLSPNAALALIRKEGAGSEKLDLWDARDGVLLRSISPLKGEVFSAAIFSPDGRYILTGGGSDYQSPCCKGSVSLWTTVDGRFVRTLEQITFR